MAGSPLIIKDLELWLQALTNTTASNAKSCYVEL